jgi:cation:H+ antiporter
VLATLSITTREALLLFSLFWAQFILGAVVPASAEGVERIVVSTAYLAIGVVIFARERRNIPLLARNGFRTSYAELTGRE